MSKRIWIALGVVVTAGIVLAVVAAGVFVMQRQQRHQDWLEAGKQYFEEGDYLLARNSLGLYLSNYPDDLDALELYIEAVLNTPFDRRDNLARGATGLSQMLRYLEPDDPRRSEIIERLMDVYIKTEAWGDLQFFVQQRLGDDPENDRLAFRLGMAYYRQGRLDEAERVFQGLADEGAPVPEAYGMLASLMADRQLLTQAQAVLDRGLELMPNDAQMHVERASFYWRLRQIELAYNELDTAIAADPSFAEAYRRKASYLNAERRFDESVENAERAIAIDPDDGITRSILAFAYRRTGRLDLAIQLLQEAEPLVRIDNPSLILALAEMYYAADRTEEGDRAVDEYLSAYPTHEAIRDYFAGRKALLEGDPARAIRELSVVYEEQPTFAPAQFFLVAAYLDAGDRERARNLLDVYLRSYPEDEGARALMAREFGQTQDPASLQDMALGVLANQNATAESLVQAALPMFNAAVVQGQMVRAAELAVRMFEEALRREPGLADAYVGLADVYAAIGQLDRAQESIERGLQAGVTPSALALSQANVYIKEDRIDAVPALMRDALQRDGLTVDDVLRWSTFLVGRALERLALEAVEAGEARLDDAADVRLGIEKGRILARLGQTAQAKTILGGIQSQSQALSGDDVRALAEARLELAQQWLREGQEQGIAEARVIVDEIRAESAFNPMAEMLYVDLITRGTRPDLAAAAQVLQGVIERDPSNVAALVAASNIAGARGDAAESRELAERAYRLVPTFIPAAIRLAEVHMELNEVSVARLTLERALDVDPENFQVLGMLAEAYMRERAQAPADRILRRLEAVAAGRPERERIAAALRSEYLRMSGEPDRAESLLRAQYDAAPNDLDIARRLAESLVGRGASADAVAVLEDFTRRRPEHTEAWVVLARMHAARGGNDNLNKASTALTRALILDPRNPDALRHMMDVQSALRNYTDALAVADRLVALRPDDADAKYRKALLLTRDQARGGEAMELVTQAIDLQDIPQYRSLRGFMFLEREQYSEALADLENVARLQTTTTAQLDLALAEAYAGSGDRERGRRFLESAQKKVTGGETLDPDRIGRIESLLSREEQSA